MLSHSHFAKKVGLGCLPAWLVFVIWERQLPTIIYTLCICVYNVLFCVQADIKNLQFGASVCIMDPWTKEL